MIIKPIKFDPDENAEYIGSCFGIPKKYLTQEVKPVTFDNPMKEVTEAKLEKLYGLSPVVFLAELIMRAENLKRLNREFHNRCK